MSPSFAESCVSRSSAHFWLSIDCSDATLNPAGVRIGSAELYLVGEYSLTNGSQRHRPRSSHRCFFRLITVEKFEEVQDSLAVGQSLGEDERIVLFVMMKPGHSFSEVRLAVHCHEFSVLFLSHSLNAAFL